MTVYSTEPIRYGTPVNIPNMTLKSVSWVTKYNAGEVREVVAIDLNSYPIVILSFHK